MTRLASVLLCLLVAACARPVPPDTAFRNPAVPISSIALFEAARLDGAWREVAGYGLGRPCAGDALVFSASGARLDGTACYLPLGPGTALAPSGPGRLRTGVGAELWVLWVDADYRTLVLGTPSGSFAAVLNRGGPIPEDRLTAARRVLGFNGYDPSRLEIAR